ncbi:MAG: hypothetical protein WBA12_00960 [Catalinimonas sp.]
MEYQVHPFRFRLKWTLINLLCRIDRFDASWSSIEQLRGEGLRHLRHVATVRSVGASTRIGGSQNLIIATVERRPSVKLVALTTGFNDLHSYGLIKCHGAGRGSYDTVR